MPQCTEGTPSRTCQYHSAPPRRGEHNARQEAGSVSAQPGTLRGGRRSLRGILLEGNVPDPNFGAAPGTSRGNSTAEICRYGHEIAKRPKACRSEELRFTACLLYSTLTTNVIK